MSTIYHNAKCDARHRCRGVYVDVSGSFDLPVGPFESKDKARIWVDANALRLAELYGPEAARVATPLPPCPVPA